MNLQNIAIFLLCPMEHANELIRTGNEISAARSGPESEPTEQPEVPTREQNSSSPPEPARNESVDQTYEPMRRIDASTATAPKHFTRTIWRGLMIRVLNLHREEGDSSEPV